MRDVIELQRRPAPAPRPQSLAFDGAHLWVGSIADSHLYALDPASWGVQEKALAPGKPWGMCTWGEELRVLCGEGAEDHRRIRRYRPGQGFHEDFLACPQDTGSQLGHDGLHLHLSQWYKRVVLALDEAGEVLRSYACPRGICGQVFVGGQLYLLNTEDEASEDYFLTRLDRQSGKAVDLARVPLKGRALAHDGHCFWTNHRERHELVAFQLPGEP